MINIILLILAVQIHEYKILHRNKSLFIIMHKLLLYEGRDWFKALFVLQLIKRVKLDVRQKLLCKLLHLKKGIHKCFFRITCTDIHHLTVRISGYGEDKKKKKSLNNSFYAKLQKQQLRTHSAVTIIYTVVTY